MTTNFLSSKKPRNNDVQGPYIFPNTPRLSVVSVLNKTFKNRYQASTGSLFRDKAFFKTLIYKLLSRWQEVMYNDRNYILFNVKFIRGTYKKLIILFYCKHEQNFQVDPILTNNIVTTTTIRND